MIAILCLIRERHAHVVPQVVLGASGDERAGVAVEVLEEVPAKLHDGAEAQMVDVDIVYRVKSQLRVQLDELKGGIAEYADRVRSAVSASINSYHSSTDGKNDARLGAAAQGTGEHPPFAQASSPRRNPERGDSRTTGRLTESDPILSHLQSERPRLEANDNLNGHTVEVRDAGHKGLGLFAQVDIAPGFELYYIGQVTSTLSGNHADSEYVMEMMPGSAGQSPLYIDGRRSTCYARFINHSPASGPADLRANAWAATQKQPNAQR